MQWEWVSEDRAVIDHSEYAPVWATGENKEVNKK